MGGEKRKHGMGPVGIIEGFAEGRGFCCFRIFFTTSSRDSFGYFYFPAFDVIPIPSLLIHSSCYNSWSAIVAFLPRFHHLHFSISESGRHAVCYILLCSSYLPLYSILNYPTPKLQCNNSTTIYISRKMSSPLTLMFIIPVEV